MDSSGQFRSDFTAFIECADCGSFVEVDVAYDPELILPYAFTCTACGQENRPDIDDSEDPDRDRDCDD